MIPQKLANLKWRQRLEEEKMLSERHLQLLAFFVSFQFFFVSKCDSLRIQSMVPINVAFSLCVWILPSERPFFFPRPLMRKMKEENGFLEQYSTYVCLSRKVRPI
jgi:hypothetical protein